jgi:hypothetical protein
MKWYDFLVVGGMAAAAGLCDHLFGAPSALGFIFGSLFVLIWQSFERFSVETKKNIEIAINWELMHTRIKFNDDIRDIVSHECKKILEKLEDKPEEQSDEIRTEI